MWAQRLLSHQGGGRGTTGGPSGGSHHDGEHNTCCLAQASARAACARPLSAHVGCVCLSTPCYAPSCPAAGWNGWRLLANAVSNPAAITEKFRKAQVSSGGKKQLNAEDGRLGAQADGQAATARMMGPNCSCSRYGWVGTGRQALGGWACRRVRGR